MAFQLLNWKHMVGEKCFNKCLVIIREKVQKRNQVERHFVPYNCWVATFTSIKKRTREWNTTGRPAKLRLLTQAKRHKNDGLGRQSGTQSFVSNKPTRFRLKPAPSGCAFNIGWWVSAAATGGARSMFKWRSFCSGCAVSPYDTCLTFYSNFIKEEKKLSFISGPCQGPDSPEQSWPLSLFNIKILKETPCSVAD